MRLQEKTQSSGFGILAAYTEKGAHHTCRLPMAT